MADAASHGQPCQRELFIWKTERRARRTPAKQTPGAVDKQNKRDKNEPNNQYAAAEDWLCFVSCRESDVNHPTLLPPTCSDLLVATNPLAGNAIFERSPIVSCFLCTLNPSTLLLRLRA